MNLFEYTLESSHVKTLKTKVALEAFIRKHERTLRASYSNRYSGTVLADTSGVRLVFKCIMEASQKLPLLKLPEFISSTVRIAEESLLASFTAHPDVVTYEEFIDTFKFNRIIRFQSLRYTALANLALIFQDNPIPFEISYGYFAGNTASAFSQIRKNGNPSNRNSSNIAVLIEMEHLKQSLHIGTKYSIIEDMLLRYNALETLPMLVENAAEQIAEVDAYARAIRTVSAKILALK